MMRIQTETSNGMKYRFIVPSTCIIQISYKRIEQIEEKELNE